MSWGDDLTKFAFGSPERNYQQSTINKPQQKLESQLFRSLEKPGAPGAFGQTADYYRGLLSNEGEDQQAFARPELRRFNEEIIPDLAEQFAGMGSGGLESSGFRNAAVNAGTDLSERLGAIRANLRQGGAQGLQNMAQFSLNPRTENIHRPETNGFVGNFAEGAAKGLGSAATSYGTGGVGGNAFPTGQLTR